MAKTTNEPDFPEDENLKKKKDEQEKGDGQAKNPEPKKGKSKENLEFKELEFDDEGMFVIDGADAVSRKRISTGSLGLDILTNGQPDGVVQMWGPDGIGKTTMLLIMGGEFQKAYNYEFVRCYLHATEGRYNPKLCKMAPNLKMTSENPKDLVFDPKTEKMVIAPIFRITRPKSGEKMFDKILRTLKQDKVHFFHIIDSVDGIESEVNEGKTMSDADKTAATASLLTKFLRQASSYANHYGHVLAFTYQVRDKIAPHMKTSGVGKNKSGGHAGDHYSNLRLGFSKLYNDLYIYENPNDQNSRVIGHYMKMDIEKASDSGNVHADAKVPFIYDHGIDREREISFLAPAYGLIGKKGSWFTKDGVNIANGESQFIKLLKADPTLSNELEKKIKEIAGIA